MELDGHCSVQYVELVLRALWRLWEIATLDVSRLISSKPVASTWKSLEMFCCFEESASFVVIYVEAIGIDEVESSCVGWFE